jgi:hypothetical protein
VIGNQSGGNMDDATLRDVSRLVDSIVLSIPFFLFAVRLFTRKALVISGLKMLLGFGLFVFTGSLLKFVIWGQQLGVTYGMLIPIGIMLFFLIVLMRNWIFAFNVEESDLRESIRKVLSRSNTQFSETASRITFVDKFITLDIEGNSIFSSARISYIGKLSTSFLPELQKDVGNSRIRKVSWLSLVVLAFGLLLLNTGISEFLPNNGMGMSTITLGGTMTFGEKVLADTLGLMPLSFILNGIVGVTLGIRLLNRHPLLLSSWWSVLPALLLPLTFVFRAILSQAIYGFDFSDSTFALVMVFLAFALFRLGRTYSVFDITESDFLECLRAVSGRHNISCEVSNSRVVLGNEKNYVAVTPSNWSTAALFIDPKSFPNYKEYLSDLRRELGKKQLAGFPKMGVSILLGSLAFLGLWLLPFGLAFVFRLFGK